MSLERQGTRVYKYTGEILKEGEYAFCKKASCWYAHPYGTDLIANLGRHTVIENDDGTITVRPSILIAGINDKGKNETWHGYLVNGIWTQL